MYFVLMSGTENMQLITLNKLSYYLELLKPFTNYFVPFTGSPFVRTWKERHNLIIFPL